MRLANHSTATDSKLSDSDTDNSTNEEWTYVTARPSRQPHSPADSNADIQDPKIRVIDYNIVLVTELPPELNIPQTISRANYMGKYGTVKQVIISSDHSSFVSHNEAVQAYVTYESKLDAAFAIAALKLHKHGHRLIKPSYGTVRYCQRFVTGNSCENQRCFYLHEKHLQDHVSGNLKQNYRRQQEKAEEVIRDNLPYFIQKQYDEFITTRQRKYEEKEICTCSAGSLWNAYVVFPSVKETLLRLIDEGAINAHKYEVEKGLYKSKIFSLNIKRQMSLPPPNDKNQETGPIEHQNSLISTNRSEDTQGLLMKTILADQVTPNCFANSDKHQKPKYTQKKAINKTDKLNIFHNIMRRALPCKIYPVSRLDFTARPDLPTFKRQALKLRTILQTCMIN